MRIFRLRIFRLGLKILWFLLPTIFLGCFVLLAAFLVWSLIETEGAAWMASYGDDLILGAWIVGLAGLVTGAPLWRARFLGMRVRPLLLLFVLTFATFVTLNQTGLICEKDGRGGCVPVLDYLFGGPPD